MTEWLVVAIIALIAVVLWHVHRALERLEALYALMLNVMAQYMESVYGLAMHNLEQYAAAFQIPQEDDKGRYA